MEMNMNKFKMLFYILFSAFVFFSLTSGDCGKQTTGPSPAKKVAAPVNIILVLTSTPLDSSSSPSTTAIVSWDASPDENSSDFKGYRVITLELNSNHPATVFQEQALGKSARSHQVNNINVLTKYQTFVIAELTDGTSSDSIKTPVYSGIFYNTNGSIDSYTSSSNSLSGYGWDVTNGEGTQYSFTQQNSKKIDLHLREESTGSLFFKSPDFLDELNGTDYKYTKMNLLGYGQDTFDGTTIDKPDSLFRTEAPVAKDGVYLLKTEEGNYIKIWVKDITQTGNPAYFNVQFYYKVQPAAGLRILKK
jgi:hypothetical protein